MRKTTWNERKKRKRGKKNRKKMENIGERIPDRMEENPIQRSLLRAIDEAITCKQRIAKKCIYFQLSFQMLSFFRGDFKLTKMKEAKHHSRPKWPIHLSHDARALSANAWARCVCIHACVGITNSNLLDNIPRVSSSQHSRLSSMAFDINLHSSNIIYSTVAKAKASTDIIVIIIKHRIKETEFT